MHPNGERGFSFLLKPQQQQKEEEEKKQVFDDKKLSWTVKKKEKVRFLGLYNTLGSLLSGGLAENRIEEAFSTKLSCRFCEAKYVWPDRNYWRSLARTGQLLIYTYRRNVYAKAHLDGVSLESTRREPHPLCLSPTLHHFVSLWRRVVRYSGKSQ